MTASYINANDSSSVKTRGLFQEASVLENIWIISGMWVWRNSMSP